MLIVISRISLYRGSLNRSSTVYSTVSRDIKTLSSQRSFELVVVSNFQTTTYLLNSVHIISTVPCTMLKLCAQGYL